MRFTIFDIEADGLLDKITKIYVLSYEIWENSICIDKGSLYSHISIRNFIEAQDVLVGHHIIEYDIPALKLIISDINIKAKLIDTLAISQGLIHKPGYKHGLEAYGERFKVPKVVVEDWINITKEHYTLRCETDVKINVLVFNYLLNILNELYDGDEEAIFNYINYLGFIKTCMHKQYKAKIKLDVDSCLESKSKLDSIFKDKFQALSNAMPKELGKIIKTFPKKPYKKNGDLSSIGIKWYSYLKDNNLPLTTKVIREAPNPGSSQQLKSWLFELGWKPRTFKDNDKGEKISQVSLPFGQGLCESVKDLFEIYPVLENLDSLYKVRHRIGLFKAFLESKDENNMVVSQSLGLTNTLRLKHLRPIANLPKVGVFFGEEVRKVLTVYDDSYLMCGADISGLESATADHWITFYDPEYVKRKRQPGFDPHTDFAVFAGKMTKEEELYYKNFDSKTQDKDEYKRIKKIRGALKQVNFSGIYGAGPSKMAETLKIPYKEAKILHTAYWKLNWAVKKIAEDCIIKTVGKDMYLYNPISKFWYYLKYKKDAFSTLNQSSGVYVFNTWLRNTYNLIESYDDDIRIVLQYHDEMALIFKKELKEEITKILQYAMDSTNNELKLNVTIAMEPVFGHDYSQVH